MKPLTVVLFSFAALSAQTFQIDSAHSSANFAVRHMMVTNVRGQLGKVSGTIQYDAKNLAASKVSASIDMNGINTNEPKRDAHLKSADFFDAEKYPKLTFESTKWWSEGGRTKIAGNLTLHGVTKPVVLDADIAPATKDAMGNQRTGATATLKLKRSDYGLTWNRALEAGGVAVSDEVNVELDIAAVQAK